MLTDTQLAEIEARAERHRLATPWPDDTHPDLLDLERLIGTDVSALLAEVKQLRAELAEREALANQSAAGLRDAVEAVIEDGDSEALAAMIVDRVVGPLAAEVKRLREELAREQEQVRVVRLVGEDNAQRAAYEAMDAERRGWQSRRSVENVTLADLKRRLKAAEDVCVMWGWTGGTDSPRDKALYQLWIRWGDIVGPAFLGPDAHPDLSDEEIARLAAQRDGTRARALSENRGEGQC